MPIFMDRHNVSEEVTAEIVAELHKEDLRIQDQFGCRGLTYWFDDVRKTAFCLIEAPNKQSIIAMHNHAHGEVPNTIIEVDSSIVESFLGRIEDPSKSQKKELNIVNHPAFRVLVVVEFEKINFIDLSEIERNDLNIQIINHVESFNGRVVKQNRDSFLISYNLTTDAIKSAQKIKADFHFSKLSQQSKIRIGLSAGLPVTDESGLFEETIKTSEYLSSISRDKIIVTSEISDLYESENQNISFNKDYIQILTTSEELFLLALNTFLEKEYSNPKLNVEEICTKLGTSASQLYRKLNGISGNSITNYLQDFRLKKSLQMIQSTEKNISEIAFENGFNSLAYFSKCFRNRYGILPSHYSKSIK
ncbi:AraC-type DNA-binding protein [Flavobacteriaceae bacterium MAR_2010_188]|nr:AraC-type DNA-binding protein [Flavobacteriaceae bacterium MAR_2010_188]